MTISLSIGNNHTLLAASFFFSWFFQARAAGTRSPTREATPTPGSDSPPAIVPTDVTGDTEPGESGALQPLQVNGTHVAAKSETKSVVSAERSVDGKGKTQGAQRQFDIEDVDDQVCVCVTAGVEGWARGGGVRKVGSGAKRSHLLRCRSGSGMKI